MPFESKKIFEEFSQFSKKKMPHSRKLEKSEFMAQILNIKVYAKKQNSINCYVSFKLLDESDQKMFPSEEDQNLTGLIFV